MIQKIDKLRYLQIGVQGENIANDIQIDVSEWVEAYPGASIHLLFKPYNAVAPSPMAITVEDGILTWQPSLGATVVTGVGYTEVRAIDPETGMIKKSRIIPTAVENSVSGVDSENPPAPFEDWVNNVLQAGEDAVDAKEIATAAKTASEAARDAAQAAAGHFQSMTAAATGRAAGANPTVTVTHSEGGHYNLLFGIPKGDKGEKGDSAPAELVSAAVDAYLEENFSNPSNPPLDRSLSSALSAAPADVVGDLKNTIIDGEEPYASIIPNAYITQEGVIQTFTGYDVYVFSTHGADKIKMLSITGSSSVANVAFAFYSSLPVLNSTSDSGSRVLYPVTTFYDFPVPSGCSWVAVRVPYSSKISLVLSDDEEYENKVSKVDTPFMDGVNFGNESFFFLTSANCATTGYIKMPKNGIRIHYNPKYASHYVEGESRARFAVYFAKEDANGKLVKADDYPSSLYDQTGFPSAAVVNDPVYFPYKDNLYFVLCIRYPEGDSFEDWADSVEVYTGKICGTSIPGIQQVRYPQPYTMTDEDFRYYTTIRVDIAMKYYSTVLPLKYVKRITCPPKRSIMAVVFTKKADNSLVKAATIFSGLSKLMYTDGEARTANGVCTIDLEEYTGKEGFIALWVTAEDKVVQNEIIASPTYSTTSDGDMGLYGADNIESLVNVEYSISEPFYFKPADGNETILDNIYKIKNLTYDMVGGSYTSRIDPDQNDIAFKAYKNMSGIFYGSYSYKGSAYYHVTRNALVSSAMNPNSDFFKSAENQGYGELTCEAFTCMMLGLDKIYKMFNLIALPIPGITVERLDLKNMSNLKPGDVIGYYAGNSAHCEVISKITYLRGKPYSIETIEQAEPFTHMSLYMSDYTVNYTNSKIISIKDIDNYTYLIKNETSHQKHLSDIFDLDVTLPNGYGNVMCNRGYNGLYILGEDILISSKSNSYIISVTRNGEYYGTIDLSNMQAVSANGYYVYNIASEISDTGYYELGVSDTVVEGFYIPSSRSVFLQSNVVTVDDISYLDYIELEFLNYGYTQYVTIGKDQFSGNTFNITETAAMIREKLSDMNLLQEDFAITGVYGIFKTPYGSYAARGTSNFVV